MRSRVLVWLFAFLLLGMQQGAQIHALSHVGGVLDRPQEQGLQAPADDTPCALCALFAGGSNGIASGDACAPKFAATSVVPQFATSAVALSSPTWYRSRAPPTFL